jgi:hypothetical protein
MQDDYEFNPEDHDIELDEIAKMHAERDMEEERKEWLREQANRFYDDFATLNIPQAVIAVMTLIRAGELSHAEVVTMLDNMIEVFEESEEYEKCHTCKLIKEGVNAKV